MKTSSHPHSQIYFTESGNQPAGSTLWQNIKGAKFKPVKGCFAIFLLFNKHSLCEEEGPSIHAYKSLWIKSSGSPGCMQATYSGIFFSPIKYISLVLDPFPQTWELYKCHFTSVTVKWLLCHSTSIFNNTKLYGGLPFLISSIIYGWQVKRSRSTVQVYQCEQTWKVFRGLIFVFG